MLPAAGLHDKREAARPTAAACEVPEGPNGQPQLRPSSEPPIFFWTTSSISPKPSASSADM